MIIKYFSNRNKLISIISIIALSVGIAGCVSTGTTEMKTSASSKLDNYKILMIDVSSEIPEASKEAINIGSLVIAKLQELNLFEKMYLVQFTPDEPSDLSLNLKIIKFRGVSRDTRVNLAGAAGLGGMALAGDSSLYAEAELKDNKTDEIVASFNVKGTSSFMGTSDNAIERIAEQVAKFINENM